MQVFRKLFGNRLEQRFIFVLVAAVSLSIILMAIVVGSQVLTHTYLEVGQRTMVRLFLLQKVLSRETVDYGSHLLKKANSLTAGREKMFLVFPDGSFLPEEVHFDSSHLTYGSFDTDSAPLQVTLDGSSWLVWTIPVSFRTENSPTGSKKYSQGNPIRLGIGHSQVIISQQVRKTMFWMVLVGFVIIIFCYFLARSLAAVVLKPISNFMYLMKEVSQGKYPRENTPVEFDEIEEWSVTFNGMVDQLRQKNTLERLLFEQEKMASIGHLSASIAHEIRNPLASISSLTQLLAERQKDDHKVQEYTAVILQESKRLNLAIEQLLAFAKPIPIAFEHVSLDSIVSSVIHLLSYEAEKVGVSLEMKEGKNGPLHCQYPIAGDVNQLKQVVINLVRNAIQAQRSSGGEVVVTICDYPERNNAEIIVSDNGPGIPPDKAEKIFEPFFSTRKKGVGLGLSICKKIVNSHGGTVTFKNRTARGGAIFSIVLPYDIDSVHGKGLSERTDGGPREASPREIA